VVFRVDDAAGQKVIDVLRLLHDGMDLERHFPPDALRGRVPD
jgi:plasmid stabilization system protein ParE